MISRHARGRVVRAVALGVLVPLVVLAGCGSGEQAYCAALKKHAAVFADDGSGTQLLRALPTLRSLAARAPDDLHDEWQTVLTALGGLAAALDAAGVDPGDYVDGQPPASVSAADRARIARAASRVSADDVVEAFGGIDQQAKDVCTLQLGL